MHARNMSRYHALKDSDYSNDLDEEEDDSIARNSNTMRKTHTSDEFLADTDVLKNQQQKFQIIHFDNDDRDHNHHSNHLYNADVGNHIQGNNSGSDFYIAAADDGTKKTRLLQQSYNSGNSESRRNNNHIYEINCSCLCQQKGFASNLKNNAARNAKSKIIWAIALCCIFMVVEFLGGYIAGSLAIMTDAAHLASDCISFVIGLIAIWLGCKPPDAKMSFGYKRFEVMGAIVSILGIWVLTATLVLVAIQRIYSNDYDLDANTMMTISGIGILINIIMIFILHTPMLDLPAGSIDASHGHSHSHSHSHNDHHGSYSHSRSHSYSHNSTSSYRRGSNDSGHVNAEPATRSLLPTGRETDDDVGAATDAIDNGELTAVELSSAPMKLNGNLLKHQQDGSEKNINLRAAVIHVIGDLVQSLGVFLAAILIKIFPKAVFLDPLCTLLFSVIVVMTTISLFKESAHLVMDSVPQGLSLDDLEMDLLNIEGVKSVHHLNVWNHTSNFSILMVHLVIDILTDSNTVLMKATHLAESAKYNIKHSTIQIERVVTS